MKNTLSIVLASAALVSAQVKLSPDGSYTCPKADTTYCADNSLAGDIIIHCSRTTSGQPGRCSNNLVGQAPIGASPARCWQSSPTAGDAACEKNCVVYAATGSFTLPASVCTPTFTASSSATSKPPGMTTITFIHPAPTTTSTKPNPGTSTITFIHPAPTTTSTKRPGTSTITFIHPSQGHGGGSSGDDDEACSTNTAGPTLTGSMSTLTTVVPTKTGGSKPPPVVTAGAAINGVNAVLGMMAAMGGLLL